MVDLIKDFLEKNSIYSYFGVEIEYHNIVLVNTDARVKFTAYTNPDDLDSREYDITLSMWEVMVFLNEQTKK